MSLHTVLLCNTDEFEHTPVRLYYRELLQISYLGLSSFPIFSQTVTDTDWVKKIRKEEGGVVCSGTFLRSLISSIFRSKKDYFRFKMKSLVSAACSKITVLFASTALLSSLNPLIGNPLIPLRISCSFQPWKHIFKILIRFEVTLKGARGRLPPPA